MSGVRILGINGIRSDGTGNTDAMLALLADRYDTVDTEYPLTSILRARPRGAQFADARLLLDQYYRDGDAVVAHSRGCLVSLRMMELGARFSTVFWFRPAMNRDFVIPLHGCQRLVVIHHPSDRAIWMGTRLWWHDFGDAGRLGLHAGDPFHPLFDRRVINVQAPDYEVRETWCHSDDFLPENIGHWAHYIDEVLARG